MRLALFDLDHTLLCGDSDVLWCEFLMRRGVLPRAAFERRNREMERAYQAGAVSALEFSSFYIGTLAGRTAADWAPLRAEFVEQVITPRIPRSSHALVQRHRLAGDRLVLSTATNRFLSEPSAALLGIDELLATDCELDAQGRFTGRATGVLNMREGKVSRLQTWLAENGLHLDELDATLYSDSINDLPLLQAVPHPVCVNPCPRLSAHARALGWPILMLHGTP